MTPEERLIYAIAYVHGGKVHAGARLHDYRMDLAAARKLGDTGVDIGSRTLLLEFAGAADPTPCPSCRAISFPRPDGTCRGCGFSRAIQRASRS